jgi:beta-glucanase (GH16 family)
VNYKYCLIKRLIFPLLLASALGARAQSAPIVPHAPLTFDDEFNTLSASSDPYLDHTLWCTCSWWFGASGTKNLKAQNGMLYMSVTDDGKGNWTGAHLSTWSPSTRGFTQKFGYFEIRFKPSGQHGILSDFYLISEHDIVTDGAYPTDEMDIFEKPKGDILFLTVHNGTAAQQWRWNEITVPENFDQNFHTLGVLWQEHSGMIEWYLDGEFVFASAKFNDTDLSPMVMTLETGVNPIFGVPDNTTSNPSKTLVDYVRVFSNDPSIPLWSAQQ